MALRLTAIELIAEVLEISPARVARSFFQDDPKTPLEKEIQELRDQLSEDF